MTNVVKIEGKLGFDKIRESVTGRCSTDYAKDRAMEEQVSVEPVEIERRLGLTDEMRVILMFEASFPSSGFVDCISFLVPLKSPYSHIDLVSLVQLRSSLDILRKVLNFSAAAATGSILC